jgi:hypothetical protein
MRHESEGDSPQNPLQRDRPYRRYPRSRYKPHSRNLSAFVTVLRWFTLGSGPHPVLCKATTTSLNITRTAIPSYPRVLIDGASPNRLLRPPNEAAQRPRIASATMTLGLTSIGAISSPMRRSLLDQVMTGKTTLEGRPGTYLTDM